LLVWDRVSDPVYVGTAALGCPPGKARPLFAAGA